MKYIVIFVFALNCSFAAIGSSPDVKKPAGQSYSVQILLSAEPLSTDNKKFKGMRDIREEVSIGPFKYKYTTGELKTFPEAIELRQKMIDAGFKGAFVVRYKDSKRITGECTNNLPAIKKNNTVAKCAPQATEKVAQQESKPQAGIGFTIVQVQPQFPGGEDSLGAYIKDHLHYPQPPLDKHTPAYVLVSFTVEYTGKINNPRIVNGLNETLDAEALRFVNAMPAWNPATLDGGAINKECNLLLDFHTPEFGKNKSAEAAVEK